MIRVFFDPCAVVIRAFQELYPGVSAEVNYCGDVGDKLGITVFEDGADPVVVISHTVPTGRVADILSHELAHVAAGPDADHGPEWAAAYAALHARYCQLVDAEFGGDVEAVSA